MRYHLVMPAAGGGRRFAATVPKQYAALGDSTVIEHALAPFEDDADCLSIVVALSPGDEHWSRVASNRKKKLRTTEGGEQRAHSVRNALRALAADVGGDDWIMVHDAARPCFTRGDLARLKLELASHAAGGLLAVPLADTLKRGSDNEVVSTVDRDGLWRAATPQVFRHALLLSALEAAIAAGKLPTDEAQAIEWAGFAPRLVAGRADNIKVTAPDDLRLAAAILAMREKN